MARTRGEEVWAAQMIEAVLGVPVTIHDDGSAPGMYDLSIDYPASPAGAVEVTASVDAESVELWKLINPPGERWIDSRLVGGWMVSVTPQARAKDLRAQLPDLLRQLEADEDRRVTLRNWGDDDVVTAALRRLGVVALAQWGTQFAGSIYLNIEHPFERMGGVVADDTNAVAEWLGHFLHHHKQSDVLRKLERSGLAERHAFVFVPGFSEADFEVVEPLMRWGAPAPTVAPSLPPSVTHVWVASSWKSGVGFRWSPDGGWATFSKLQDEDDE